MAKYVLSLLLCFTPLLTFGAAFVEGTDYEVIKESDAAPYRSGPVAVTEFFSYGCPWCYRLEASVSKWSEKQGKSIHFTKVPVVFNKNWADYARAYYLIDSLSLNKSVHETLFKAIALDKQPLDSHQAIVNFFTQHGVEPVVAESAFAQSPSIELRLKADALLMSKFQINAVPTLVVNHQYKTNLQLAKTEDRLFQILDYLLQKVKTRD